MRAYGAHADMHAHAHAYACTHTHTHVERRTIYFSMLGTYVYICKWIYLLVGRVDLPLRIIAYALQS